MLHSISMEKNMQKQLNTSLDVRKPLGDEQIKYDIVEWCYGDFYHNTLYIFFCTHNQSVFTVSPPPLIPTILIRQRTQYMHIQVNQDAMSGILIVMRIGYLKFLMLGTRYRIICLISCPTSEWSAKQSFLTLYMINNHKPISCRVGWTLMTVHIRVITWEWW